ncbi:MAG TPA: A/G-specific adenine glycosylase, partial [Rhodothermales bacterium]
MTHSESDVRQIRDALGRWFADNARSMPWRRTRDPYRVWVSEVMLQQTRVEQATPYYERFVDAFPSVEALAEAELDEVLRLWEGLGYYSRARHLHAAARQVVARHGGRVPEDYDAFRSLPGVGTYTAAAVMSIVRDHPAAAVDGNVIRVLSRLYALEEDVSTTAGKRRVTELADWLLDRDRPGRHNEAMMELGATVCLPTSPRCEVCPLAPFCRARETGEPQRYPVRAVRERVPHYDVAVGLVYRANDELLIQRRAEEGLLGGLWEFPGGKQEPGETLESTCVRELREELGIEVAVEDLVQSVRHA